MLKYFQLLLQNQFDFDQDILSPPKGEQRLTRLKRLLKTRFNINPLIPDEDQKRFRISKKIVAIVTLQCTGQGLGQG